MGVRYCECAQKKKPLENGNSPMARKVFLLWNILKYYNFILRY